MSRGKQVPNRLPHDFGVITINGGYESQKIYLDQDEESGSLFLYQASSDGQGGRNGHQIIYIFKSLGT